MLAFVSLILALAFPRIEVQRDALNVIAIVDITQSMNVVDEMSAGQPVSRLEFVKRALRHAVAELPCGSKLGSGIFTQYRSLVLLMPVETCANRRELDEALEGIQGQMAWAGGSEIAKGIYLTLRMLKTLEGPPALAFITDGHEAPPVNPLHRIDVGSEAGPVRGLLIGVGSLMPKPIPKVDPDGNAAGFWGPRDVMQEDLYVHGRQGNAANEMMEESDSGAPVSDALRGTPGAEHLSALREPYLELLAAESQLRYVRLTSDTALTQVFGKGGLARPEPALADMRWLGGALALMALTLPFARRWVRYCRYRYTASQCTSTFK